MNTAKTFALKEQLSKAGVTDADYLIYKQGGIDKFTFDKDGKPVGVDDILKPLREDKTYSHLFAEKGGAYTPKGGSGSSDVGQRKHSILPNREKFIKTTLLKQKY